VVARLISDRAATFIYSDLTEGQNEDIKIVGQRSNFGVIGVSTNRL
jgi:hypothetical protein